MSRPWDSNSVLPLERAGTESNAAPQGHSITSLPWDVLSVFDSVHVFSKGGIESNRGPRHPTPRTIGAGSLGRRTTVLGYLQSPPWRALPAIGEAALRFA
jgi:hypothetical protein